MRIIIWVLKLDMCHWYPMLDWVSKIDTTGAHNGILIDPTDQRIAFNLLTSELSCLRRAK